MTALIPRLGSSLLNVVSPHHLAIICCRSKGHTADTWCWFRARVTACSRAVPGLLGMRPVTGLVGTTRSVWLCCSGSGMLALRVGSAAEPASHSLATGSIPRRAERHTTLRAHARTCCARAVDVVAHARGYIQVAVVFWSSCPPLLLSLAWGPDPTFLDAGRSPTVTKDPHPTKALLLLALAGVEWESP